MSSNTVPWFIVPYYFHFTFADFFLYFHCYYRLGVSQCEYLSFSYKLVNVHHNLNFILL